MYFFRQYHLPQRARFYVDREIQLPGAVVTIMTLKQVRFSIKWASIRFNDSTYLDDFLTLLSFLLTGSLLLDNQPNHQLLSSSQMTNNHHSDQQKILV